MTQVTKSVIVLGLVWLQKVFKFSVKAKKLTFDDHRNIHWEKYNMSNVESTYNVKYTMYSVYCTVYNVKCLLYSVQCTVHNVQCTMSTVQYKMYNVQCTMYSVQCPVYNVQCTM